MSANYYSQNDGWLVPVEEDEWYPDDYEYDYAGYYPAQRSYPIDIVALLLVMGVILVLIFGLSHLVRGNAATAVTTIPQTTTKTEEETAVPKNIFPDPQTFIAPYDDYIITQGPHGFSYGHAAIDIAAGKDAPIKAPISGTITQRYTDPIGNPVLVIENEQYLVTFLHGKYSVQVGEEIGIGGVIGNESNLGNTRDMQGNSCRNRDCGYHTHLNVFDKQLNQNVNPLDLID